MDNHENFCYMILILILTAYKKINLLFLFVYSEFLAIKKYIYSCVPSNFLYVYLVSKPIEESSVKTKKILLYFYGK